MTKKEIQKIITYKLKSFTLNKDIKEIWLLPYTNDENEPSCDILENELELFYQVKMFIDYGYDYGIIKLIKGE
jgi:hypothetical protein